MMAGMTQSKNPSNSECQLGSADFNRATAASALRPGLSSLWKIDRSCLERKEKLGTGAVGTVFKALCRGKEVAEKTFIGSDNPSFLREVSLLAGLSHPNIVTLHHFAMDEHGCSIVMELMDGDLSSLMRDRMYCNNTLDAPFSISQGIDIMSQVAEAVNYLHEHKIVHRDLKSSNVLVKRVKPNGVDAEVVSAKVADFGLSKTKESSHTYSNQTPNIGSTRWMAPELYGGNQVHGELKYPFKTDVYSFGLVCYEILTGKLPFSNIDNPEVREKVADGHRPKLPPRCPKELRTLIEDCWKPDASARPCFFDICVELRRLKSLHPTGYNYDGECSGVDMPTARSSEAQCSVVDDLKERTAIRNQGYHKNAACGVVLFLLFIIIPRILSNMVFWPDSSHQESRTSQESGLRGGSDFHHHSGDVACIVSIDRLYSQPSIYFSLEKQEIRNICNGLEHLHCNADMSNCNSIQVQLLAMVTVKITHPLSPSRPATRSLTESWLFVRGSLQLRIVQDFNDHEVKGPTPMSSSCQGPNTNGELAISTIGLAPSDPPFITSVALFTSVVGFLLQA